TRHRKSPFIILFDKVELVPRILLMVQVGAVVVVDCRSHCCTDQAPGREEVVEVAGCTPDFRIRRRGQRHSLIELKCPRQAK
ncbi:MAG: hypothetical protein ACYDC7_04165, partial [Acidithiobacillus ferrivorans]